MSQAIEANLSKLGDFLTRDRPSPIDPWVKWVGKPWAILALATLAAILCGLFLHPRAFVPAAGLAAVLAVGLAWPWIALRGLSGTLTFDRERAREGESVAVRLTLRNRMPWGAWGLVVRGGVLDGSGASLSLAHAAGWRSTETAWEVIPACRGEYPKAVPRIASAFPFGLRESSRPLSVSSRLLVWPRTFPVGPVPEAAGGRDGDGLAPRNKPGTSGELLGVRPYRRGDSIRRIHWPQTARHDRLVVCEVQSQAIPRVRLVLDAHPASHVGAAPDGTLEWSIRIAASFAESWLGQGADVELVGTDRPIAAPAGSVRARRTRLLDALARLEPDPNVTLRDVLAAPAHRRAEGGLTLMITTDRGLRGLARPTAGTSAERFIVLESTSFADVGEAVDDPGPLPVRPWIRVEDPGRVSQAIRWGWREVALER